VLNSGKECYTTSEKVYTSPNHKTKISSCLVFYGLQFLPLMHCMQNVEVRAGEIIQARTNVLKLLTPMLTFINTYVLYMT